MKVGVMGAGAIGCYVGGRLREVGVPVVLVGRASLTGEIAQHGLHLSDYRGHQGRITDIEVATEPAALSTCDIVLVTVKGGDTRAAGESLAPVLPNTTTVVSFQNGVRNPEVLREVLPGRVLAGMVPFNVLRSEEAHFHQGTSGTLAIESAAQAEPLVAALRKAGLPIEAHADMRGVLWGKLLVNLNNSINALAGVPIKEMIQSRNYRRVMAACMGEGLEMVALDGIRPRLDVPLPPRFVPRVLRLPNTLFSLIARSMLRVDPKARSSMWDDLQRGRKTEIDALNGEIVALAQRHGRPAPVNAAIARLVKEAEGKGSPGLSAESLLAAIR